MKLEYLSPDVTTLSLDDRELTVVADATQDLIPQIDTFTEAELLDTTQARAQESQESLTEIRDFLVSAALHDEVKITLVDLVGLPLYEGPTPTAHPLPGEPNLYPQDLYRGYVLGLMGLYGYGYSSQQHGTVHNNIVPIREYATTTGHNASSESELGLHSEVASFNLGEGKDVSPDFLTLHYFRNDQNVPTTVSIPNWSEVSDETRELLSETWFYNRTSPAQGGAKNDPTIPVSVLYGDDSDPWIRLNTSRLDLELYSGVQRDALIEFVTHLRARGYGLPVGAGKLALIDNRRVLHGRAAFKPEHKAMYDGTDRWQRRITASTDAARIAHYAINSPRVVDMELFREKTATQG